LKVGHARVKHGIKYPLVYNPENGGNNIFNCVQRAHQNTLETYPTFLMLLFTGGISLPRMTSAAGTAYVFGRILYAQGYYTGKPENRLRGTPFYLPSLLTLLFCSLHTASKVLQWI